MKKPIAFGKYLLLERVNVGGMAEVFLGKAFGVEGFERLLAIKRVLPTMVEDEEFITMFLDEARISVQLNHANVVQIHELGKHDDSFYIAMEYISGKDLRHLFERFRKRKETMPTAMAVFVASKICEGLDYAHRRKDARGMDLNIVHRDVSPQNILISFDGEVKIIDFGIAKAANRAQKTQAGILKGKFGYMSPEQVRGLPIDRRSDLFAVGVILYEMLTGEKLFVGESDFSTLEKVRNAEVLPPRQYNSAIPVGLEKVVMKALARDVEDRYQWCSDLQEDLMRFLLSGDSIFSTKHLATFMKEAFAEDLAKETERLERYADVERPGDLEISGVTASPGVKPAPRRAPTPEPVKRKATMPATPAALEYGDPNNPVIPPPDPDEFPEEGQDRTQIFRPDFNGKEELKSPPRAEPPRAEPPPPQKLSARPTTALPAIEDHDGTPPEEAATVMGIQSPLLNRGAVDADEDDDEATNPPERVTAPVGRPPSRQVPAARPPPRRTPQPAPEEEPVDEPVEPDEQEERTGPSHELDRYATTAPTLSRSKRPIVFAAGGAAVMVVLLLVVVLVKGRAPSTGKLFVVVTPEELAKVTVDGAPIQPGDLVGGVALSPGEHMVAASASGYRSVSRKVTVAAGQPVSVPVTLTKVEPEGEEPKTEEAAAEPTKPSEPEKTAEPAVAKEPARDEPKTKTAEPAVAKEPVKPQAKALKTFDLKVESIPAGADIEIAGRKFGKTNRTVTGLDPAKVQKVKLSLRGYQAVTLDVPEWDHQTKQLSVFGALEKAPEPVKAEPKTTSVEKAEVKPKLAVEKTEVKGKTEKAPKGLGKIITSSMPVAKVLLDGKDTGRSTPIAPAVPLEVPAGDHTLTYVAPDGRKAVRKVSVKVGETEKVLKVADFQ